MLTASPETLKIRQIIECLSDDELRSRGPGDFREAVEAAGLDFQAVRDKVNNELARQRRKRGIRKGQGRRRSSDELGANDQESRRLYRLYCRLDASRKLHGSASEIRLLVEEVIELLKLSETPEELLDAIKIMQENEEAEQHDCRGKHASRPHKRLAASAP